MAVAFLRWIERSRPARPAVVVLLALVLSACSPVTPQTVSPPGSRVTVPDEDFILEVTPAASGN